MLQTLNPVSVFSSLSYRTSLASFNKEHHPHPVSGDKTKRTTSPTGLPVYIPVISNECGTWGAL